MSCIKLIVSDFDGTLVDTFRANLEAYRVAFNEFGYELTEQQYRKRFGLRFDAFMESMGISDEVVKEKIKETKSLVYPDYFSLLRVNNTLLSLIRSFKDSGGKTALASTARRKNLRNILTYIAASDVFDQILAGEDVAAGKPDPEIYIKAMERFGVAAGETLVFEDSEAGFKAAGNAGIPYIKINSTWYNEH